MLVNETVELANSIETTETNVVVSNTVSRNDRFNKANEGNENLKDKCEEYNLQLILHSINTFRHTNAKGLHLNNYGDKQLTRNFTTFIKNG